MVDLPLVPLRRWALGAIIVGLGLAFVIALVFRFAGLVIFVVPGSLAGAAVYGRADGRD